MFFKVSTKHHQLEYPLSQTYHFDKFVCQLDQGWKKHENIVYKGYCIDQNIDDKVRSKNFYSEKGNYTILDFTDNFALYYDDTKGFPLFYSYDTVHNIPTTKNDSYNEVYHDGGVIYENNQFQWISKKNNQILFDSARKRRTTDQLVDWLCEYILDSASKLDTDLPLYACDSNGVDTTLVQSAFDYLGLSYSKVKTQDNKVMLSFYYSYENLYCGNFEPHLQLTGWCGDEYILRNPLYCHWLLQSQGVDLIEEYNKRQHCYMKGFFEDIYLYKIQKDKHNFETFEDAFNHVANVAINDNQMWHYDNIITFTPFQNKDVLETMLYANTDSVIAQVTDAEISKKAIKKLNPSNLNKITINKNDYTPIFNLDYNKI